PRTVSNINNNHNTIVLYSYNRQPCASYITTVADDFINLQQSIEGPGNSGSSNTITTNIKDHNDDDNNIDQTESSNMEEGLRTASSTMTRMEIGRLIKPDSLLEDISIERQIAIRNLINAMPIPAPAPAPAPAAPSELELEAECPDLVCTLVQVLKP
ncbi:hypothetical protein BG015_002989, partial [Linnemannia schmuckeri]